MSGCDPHRTPCTVTAGRPPPGNHPREPRRPSGFLGLSGSARSLSGKRLQRGDTSIAGESGHIVVNPSGDAQCGCGATGCLEAMASGTALGRLGRRAAAIDPTGLLAGLAGQAEDVTGETVHEAARQADPAALRLFNQIVATWSGH